MSKKRKKTNTSQVRKRDNSPHNNPVLKKKYLKILERICYQTDCETAFKLLSKDEKSNAFGHRVYIGSIKFKNKKAVSKDALEFFTKYVQDFYADSIYKLQPDREVELTNFEILAGLQFLTSFDNLTGERKNQLQIAFTPMRLKLGTLQDAIKTIIFHYTITANGTNIFNDTLYNLKFDFKVKEYPTLGMHYFSTLEAVPCRSGNYIENGKLRKVFQLGYLDYGFTVNWVSVPVKSLQGVYRGDKKELPLCIQNHAYNRLLERLKPLSGMDIIHQLSYTLQTSLKIEIYKGNILIPYFHINLKCGYFLGVINKDRLIIKTFLFLTHHYTPEGDKLEKVLGLSKEEISYWKIGSLENFFGSNLETNHEMRKAFEDAGISHLFTVQSIGCEKEQRNYNWEALNAYINQGKTELFDEGAEDEMLEELVEEGLDE